MEHAHVTSHKKTYIAIFFSLAILTAIELYIPTYFAHQKNLKIALLIFFASLKAFLVAYFFMHLNEEKKLLRYIAALPLLAVAYTVMVILESWNR